MYLLLARGRDSEGPHLELERSDHGTGREAGTSGRWTTPEGVLSTFSSSPGAVVSAARCLGCLCLREILQLSRELGLGLAVYPGRPGGPAFQSSAKSS